eukprot:6009763-Pleurochrysis_carterae.AAC.1
MSCVFPCRPSCKCMLCSVGVCSMHMVILLLLFETRWLRLSMKAATVDDSCDYRLPCITATEHRKIDT